MPKLATQNPPSKPSSTKKSPAPPNSSAPKPSKNGDASKPEQKPSTEAPATAESKPNGKLKKPKPVKESREILYPRIETRVFVSDSAKAPIGPGGKPAPAAFTPEIAKEVIGWQDEEQFAEALKGQYTAAELKNIDTSFGEDYLFRDRYGKKIRCGNNLHNRPFYPKTAEAWMLEILRRKWRFNGESMVVDKYGGCQDIQHRAVGLIWAAQEWAIDAQLPKPQQKWQKYWKQEPYIDCLIVFGIEDSDDVVNTINTGKPRTFSDALYRSSWFAGKPVDVRDRLAKITANAVNFLWDRTSARLGSNAPHRPHSESFEFLDSHKKLLDCVKFISEEGDGKKITTYIGLGRAATLLYLMGSARSNAEDYVASPSDKSLDWSLYDKAEEFWTLFCANAAAIEPLREELERLPLEITKEAFKIALFIKAWNLFSDGKKLTRDELELDMGDVDGVFTLREHPRIGGIDVAYEEEEDLNREPPEGGEESADDLAARGICPKTGEAHIWKTEEGETFCQDCFDPKPGPSR